MREIKFRQAIFLNGEFYAWHYWGFIDGMFVGPDTGMSSVLGALKSSQMFTTLPDKNGKEIYEGDIIQDENGTAEVVFHRAGFLNKPHNAPPYLITIWEECEVIGNIYSNSELLEVKDGPSGK